MTTPETNRCARCGAELPSTSTDELCAACLLSGALNAPASVAATAAADYSKTLPLRGDRSKSRTRRPPTSLPCEFGGYRLLRELGQGGMGTVFEAEQLSTGRRVALKTLSWQADSPEARQRFLREGRLAAGVNHPNSLYVFGAEEIEGLPVIVMEVAAAGTLSDQLKADGPLPVKRAVDAALHVIDGLEAALEAGVLHRDIKPSNCFLSPDGSVKVGDYGLSVSAIREADTALTAPGMALGTPAFASPEQLCGNDLDQRADIYSVGATLYTLLTGRAPFAGENAVQIVANAVNQPPPPPSSFREDIPPELERVVVRCLAKERERRYADYEALRNALLPHSSREAEPASMKIRTAAGWIDYLIAFLAPYVALMFSVTAKEFHLLPLIDRTLGSARYYLLFLAVGFAYFTIAEGLWGAGLGKRLTGLRVIRPDGRPPGFLRAFVRVFIPILAIEIVRIPFLLATIRITDFNQWTGTHTLLFVGATNVCPWIAVLLTLSARRENGFATLWDRLTGTRVVIAPKGLAGPSVASESEPAPPSGERRLIGPFEVVGDRVSEDWLTALDPTLQRPVWLIRREGSGPTSARRALARHGRLRWLQEVRSDDATWDAYEAPAGIPFHELAARNGALPWSKLRHWLHDAATEVWAANGDGTLPAKLGLDHVWIAASGHAALLDRPWPNPLPLAEVFPVGNLAGQQRFLSAVAAHADPATVPIHARSALRNLEAVKFEKLAFLTGALRGFLGKPAEVTRTLRAGSIFLLPVYLWLLLFLGLFRGDEGSPVSPGWTALVSAAIALGGVALSDLVGVLFRGSSGHSIFQLAIIDHRGEAASRLRLFARWALVWLSLLLPMGLVFLLYDAGTEARLGAAGTVLLLWSGAAATAAFSPTCGPHDRLAGTKVVRR